MICGFRLKQLEKNFILDGVPLSKLANDEVGRTQPSLNIGIPQYSAFRDPSCKNYFTSKAVSKVVKKTAIKKEEESSLGRFLNSSSAKKYLDNRMKIGAGMSYYILINTKSA